MSVKVFDWDNGSYTNVLVQNFENIQDIDWSTPELLTVLFQVLPVPSLLESG